VASNAISRYPGYVLSDVCMYGSDERTCGCVRTYRAQGRIFSRRPLAALLVATVPHQWVPEALDTVYRVKNHRVNRKLTVSDTPKKMHFPYHFSVDRVGMTLDRVILRRPCNIKSTPCHAKRDRVKNCDSFQQRFRDRSR
jgi:hypothetical protein